MSHESELSHVSTFGIWVESELCQSRKVQCWVESEFSHLDCHMSQSRVSPKNLSRAQPWSPSPPGSLCAVSAATVGSGGSDYPVYSTWKPTGPAHYAMIGPSFIGSTNSSAACTMVPPPPAAGASAAGGCRRQGGGEAGYLRQAQGWVPGGYRRQEGEWALENVFKGIMRSIDSQPTSWPTCINLGHNVSLSGINVFKLILRVH